MIDYQLKDSFITQLVNLVSRITEGLNTKKYKTNAELVESALGKELEKAIRERFGLNIVLDKLLHQHYPAAIVPFSSDYLLGTSGYNKSNGFSERAGFLERLFSSKKGLIRHFQTINKQRQQSAILSHNKSGSINLKTARVTGYLSEVRHYLIINFKSLIGLGLTDSEIAAVIVHEIGHAFSGLETHYKTTRTNSAIAAIVDEINANRPDRVYYTYKRYFGPEDLVEASLSEDSKVIDFYGPLANRYIKSLDSQLLNAKYDQTNFEYLADNFATRFGLGKDLVSGLNRIHEKYDLSLVTSRTAFYTLHLFDLIFTAAALTVTGPLGFIILGLMFMSSGKGNANLTYDIPKDRYNRIRNAIVDNLKDPQLPKEYSAELLKQFDYIDEVMQNSITRESILEMLANVVKPDSREAVYYVGLQQQAENALNNILFVKSAKLRHV